MQRHLKEANVGDRQMNKAQTMARLRTIADIRTHVANCAVNEVFVYLFVFVRLCSNIIYLTGIVSTVWDPRSR